LSITTWYRLLIIGKGDIVMSAIKEVTVAGSSIFVKVRKKRKKREKGEKRAARKNHSSEELEKLNQRNAEKTLAILMNYNLKDGSWHLVLTYAGEEPKQADAKKYLKKFKRDLAKLYREKGILLKWFGTTEYDNERIHHHIVCTGEVSIEDIRSIWDHGMIWDRPLYSKGDYRKLAEYIIKETSKTFRNDDSVNKKRFSCSRSIVRPMPNEDEDVSDDHMDDPQPIKGYYIDQDSIYRGENPETGQKYVEYVMISLTEEPRVKKWNRGKKIKLRTETYKINYDKQIKLELKYFD
jgi:hypothetical protein